MVGRCNDGTAVIHIVCDFGTAGPYLGEMRTALYRSAPHGHAEILMSDMPRFDPKASAYLLAALARRFEPGDVCLAIVDPGVGTERAALALMVDDVWFVGPDNGLFECVLRHCRSWRAQRITWRPKELSASFHGRDLFAPVAAKLASGRTVDLAAHDPARFPDWPDDLPAVIYADGYGNLVSAHRAPAISNSAKLVVAGKEICGTRTFGDAAPGALFWYENSMGLIEVAANRARASDLLGYATGQIMPFSFADGLHGQG